MPSTKGKGDAYEANSRNAPRVDGTDRPVDPALSDAAGAFSPP